MSRGDNLLIPEVVAELPVLWGSGWGNEMRAVGVFACLNIPETTVKLILTVDSFKILLPFFGKQIKNKACQQKSSRVSLLVNVFAIFS